MVEQSALEYVERALARLTDDCFAEAQQEVNKQKLSASASGNLYSGRMMIVVRSEYEKALRIAASKTSRAAYDATSSTDAEIAEVLHKELNALRNQFSDELRKFFCSHTSFDHAADRVGSEFLDTSNQIISGVVDDYRHQMSGGTKLTKDPVVSVTSNITNSPGAVSQTGIGNIQNAIALNGTSQLQIALSKFANSQEVASLPDDKRIAVTDMTDVLSTELDEAEPDPSKIARWGTRLIEMAQEFGIGVAASALASALFG